MEVKRKKCKVVMLPTDKADNAIIKHYGTLEYYSNEIFTQEYLKNQNKTSNHVYVLSDDIIRDGDRFYNEEYGIGEYVHLPDVGNKLRKCYRFDKLTTPNPLLLPNGIKKIIATTDKSLFSLESVGTNEDTLGVPINYEEVEEVFNKINLPQPSKTFIEKYCKVGGIDDVMVEYIDTCEENKVCKNVISENYNICLEECKNLKLKINSHNEITIHSIKNNYSKEEVKEILLNYSNSQYGTLKNSEYVLDWFNQNV